MGSCSVILKLVDFKFTAILSSKEIGIFAYDEKALMDKPMNQNLEAKLSKIKLSLCNLGTKIV